VQYVEFHVEVHPATVGNFNNSVRSKTVSIRPSLRLSWKTNTKTEASLRSVLS